MIKCTSRVICDDTHTYAKNVKTTNWIQSIINKSVKNDLFHIISCRISQKIRMVGEFGPLFWRIRTTLLQSKVVLFARQSGSNCQNVQISSDNWNHLVGIGTTLGKGAKKNLKCKLFLRGEVDPKAYI